MTPRKTAFAGATLLLYFTITLGAALTAERSTDAIKTSQKALFPGDASTLLSMYNSVVGSTTVDVAPEATSPLTVTLWNQSDTLKRCLPTSAMRSALRDVFPTLTKNFVGDKRKARTYVRSVFYMSQPMIIEGIEARCLSDANYEEITDILVTFAQSSSLTRPASLSSPTTLIRAKAVGGPADANSIPGPVDIATSLFTALRLGATPSPSPRPPTPSPSPSPAPCTACPYWNTVCCSAYCTPGVSDPQQVYLDCCFQDQYPQIASDWDTYYADLYPTMTPEEYTLQYCMLSSVN